MRRHIGQQTSQRISLLPAPAIDGGDGGRAALDALLSDEPDAVLVDLLDGSAEPRVGALLARMAARRSPLFVLGSSGVEYALAASWKVDGLVLAEPSAMSATSVDRILVVSGSCSPATGAQIRTAVAGGFAEIALDPMALIREGARGEHARTATDAAITLLENGRSVVCHTSTGPADPREASVNGHYAKLGRSHEEGRIEGGRALAHAAGVMLDGILRRVPLGRFVVAGGDTSTAAIKALGIDALEMVAPLAPGAPLCRALAPGRDLHGRELVLKGGQIGGPDFFTQARAGRL
jgi:uncharacterized protein YgbK (DUF1537 family)